MAAQPSMKSFAVDRLGRTGIATLSGLDVHRRCLPDAFAGRKAKLGMHSVSTGGDHQATSASVGAA
jgi:hypothetical protein